MEPTVANLFWVQSRWTAHHEAVGRSALYVVMAVPAATAVSGTYVASVRGSWSDEPKYLGSFSLDQTGLDAARNACQMHEDASATATVMS